MGTLVVKNLPDDLHEQLKQQARKNHRSVTKEVVKLIESAVANIPEQRTTPTPIRLKSGFRPTIDDIEEAIADGQK